MQLPTRRPLDYFDELRASQHIASIGETSPDNTSSLLNANNGTIRLGHLLSLMVISEPIPDALNNKRRIRKGTLDVEIAAFLGIHHFNERSGAVITDLPDRLKDCNIYFTMDLRDSQGTPLQSSRQVLSSVNNDAKNATNKNITYPFPTGIVGTGRSSTAAPTSVLSGIFSVPQVTCCATSRAITSNSNSPMFARTVPTNQQDAVAAAEYLSRSLGLTHVGVVFVQGAYGEQFAADFRNAANARSMTVVSASYDESTPESIDRAIERIRVSRIRYIFGIFYQDNLSSVMKSANRANLIGNGYTWLFSESLNRLAGPSLFFDKEKDKEVIEAVNGSGVLLLSVPPNDLFDQAISSFRADQELQEYYISRHASATLFDGFNMSDSDSLRSTYFAQLNYDASIALGLAACDAEAQYPNGRDVFRSLLKTTFQGSSGPVKFNSVSASRSHLGLEFKVMNIKAEEPNLDGQVFLTSQTSATIDFLSPKVVHDVKPFIYAGGSAEAPPFLPAVQADLNKISGPALAGGYTVCGVLMLMSLAWIWWAVRYRKKQTVRAAQPLFLVMLCAGTFVLASSIIPMGFQEPMAVRTLDAGCMLVPWLASIGFTTSFSALFSKLWRIGRLHKASENFQKITIKPHHVLLPFAVLLTLNVILLTSWTTISPLRWTRSPHPSRSDSFGRSIESFGKCQGDNDTLTTVFTWSLVVLNLICLAIAIIQSYRTRELPTMFNESHYIVLSLLSMLEASVMGLPLLWFVADFPTPNFLVRAVVVSIFCLAIMLPIFVPKARIQRSQITGRFSIDVVTSPNLRRGSMADSSGRLNTHCSHAPRRRGALTQPALPCDDN